MLLSAALTLAIASLAPWSEGSLNCMPVTPCRGGCTGMPVTLSVDHAPSGSLVQSKICIQQGIGISCNIKNNPGSSSARHTHSHSSCAVGIAPDPPPKTWAEVRSCDDLILYCA